MSNFNWKKFEVENNLFQVETIDVLLTNANKTSCRSLETKNPNKGNCSLDF